MQHVTLSLHATFAASANADTPVATRQSREFVVQLQKSEIYRDYRRAFEATTGLPLAVRAVGTFQLPFQGSRQINPFCTLMAARNQSCAACLRAQQELEQKAYDGPQTVECFAGLSESAVPVRVGEKTLAHLQTGQVLLRPPTQAGFARVLRQLGEWKTDIDRRQLEAAYFATRVVTRAQYGSVLRLLAIFGQHLSALSNQLMVREAAAELPAVAKARAFIAENQGEQLSLGQVARAVGMSAFYFCKMFRKTTGLTFTNYVARRRVESVKQMLLAPHVRVSEAAYAAGFQSLSQFNRIFRRVTGQAPSGYRAQPESESLAHAA
jgi:AraC-like DNA-binding protein/ligand-binding sensor protein